MNAGTAAAAAIQAYDADGNKSLSAEELKKSPGIKEAIKTSDSNQDGELSQSELQTRVSKMVGDEVALMSLSVKILYDGQPLPEALVTMIPDPCLGKSFNTSSGTTASDGNAGMRMNEQTPGVQCGWFRIEISKKDASGKEMIPAAYNTESTLGAEIALDTPNLERGLTLQLSSNPKPN